MNKELKSIIYEMIQKLDPVEDYRFLSQLYTIIRRHLTNKGKR